MFVLFGQNKFNILLLSLLVSQGLRSLKSTTLWFTRKNVMESSTCFDITGFKFCRHLIRHKHVSFLIEWTFRKCFLETLIRRLPVLFYCHPPSEIYIQSIRPICIRCSKNAYVIISKGSYVAAAGVLPVAPFPIDFAINISLFVLIQKLK